MIPSSAGTISLTPPLESEGDMKLVEHPPVGNQHLPSAKYEVSQLYVRDTSEPISRNDQQVEIRCPLPIDTLSSIT